MLLPFVQKVGDHLSHTAESQVFKSQGRSMKELQDVKAIRQPRNRHNLWCRELVESSVYYTWKSSD